MTKERYAIAYRFCNNSPSCYCNNGWTVLDEDEQGNHFESSWDAYHYYDNKFHGEHKQIFIYRLGNEPSFVDEDTRRG